MKFTRLSLVLLLCFGCKSEVKKDTIVETANTIINKSIEASGGTLFDNADVMIDFAFRNNNYKATYTKTSKTLERLMVKDTDTIRDVLKGNTFQRYINQKLVKVADSMATRYSASVNSVHYFSILPHGLNDKAVQKELLDTETINNKTYYKIRVTFSEDGGGEDFDDVFVYWINKTTYLPDFLAYSYNEADGKGMRFRVAYNERYVEGLRIVDYDNYKPNDKSATVLDLAKHYEEGKLTLLSKIELEDVFVGLGKE